MKTNAPWILWNEANHEYSLGADLAKSGNVYKSKCIGSRVWCHAEKAIAANASVFRLA